MKILRTSVNVRTTAATLVCAVTSFTCCAILNVCTLVAEQSAIETSTQQSASGRNDNDANCNVIVYGSPFIPVDSWIYPAVLRLYALGYLDRAYLNLRPWTRTSLRHTLDETGARLQRAGGDPGENEAEGIYESLLRELRDDTANSCQMETGCAQIESVYTVARGISGTPLHDSYHLGSTLVNDYGRQYANGFNNYTGTSVYAHTGRFLLYVRGEFQGVPATTGYSPSMAAQLAAIDGTTYYYSTTCLESGTTCTPIPYNQQATIPAGPAASVIRGRVIEAYASAQYLNHVIVFGKQDEWLGPGVGSSMAYSNNAENIYAFHINRIEPLTVPLLSRLTGPFRYEFLIGPMKGHVYPRNPWVHVEKIGFRPTENIEFGFERTVILGGEGHEAVTIKSFLRSFFSLTAPSSANKNSSADPGARFGSFDFSYRLPFVRNWLTLYADSEVHDDVSPIDAPRRAAWRPGVYLSHFPALQRLDLRVEAASTDPPITNSKKGRFMYWEVIQRQGYTNQGQIFGDWIGREGKGGQGWITYHLSGNEWIQLSVRNQKAEKDFIPGGTTLNDINVQTVKRFGRDIEIVCNFTFERWKAPIYLPGQQTVTATTIQFTWFPARKVGF